MTVRLQTGDFETREKEIQFLHPVLPPLMEVVEFTSSSSQVHTQHCTTSLCYWYFPFLVQSIPPALPPVLSTSFLVSRYLFFLLLQNLSLFTRHHRPSSKCVLTGYKCGMTVDFCRWVCSFSLSREAHISPAVLTFFPFLDYVLWIWLSFLNPCTAFPLVALVPALVAA